MNIEEFRALCIALPEATEDMPFDDTVVVFRLKDKIFGCIGLENNHLGVLKCDPDLATELRERYSSIAPAYHWNKKFWNQIELGDTPDVLISNLIRHAYNEVNKKLTKKTQVAMLEIEGPLY